MGENSILRRGFSLKTKIAGWLIAILLVTLLSIGVAAVVGRWTLHAFNGLLSDNAACYNVQDAIEAETTAFARYIRERSQESEQTYLAACEATEQSLAALPFDVRQIGEDRYARTWNLVQGYAGYQKYRDAFLQIPSSAETYVEQMYSVMALQGYLASYALRLTQATLEQQTDVYSSSATLLERLPWLYLALIVAAVTLMALLLRVLSATVAGPLLRMAKASRSIAQNDYTGEDLPVKSHDEVGQLTDTFKQMKHAMADHLSTLNALHREEVHSLELESDLEHTRLEVLKSQVNPHFLFNTLNMISCMARLEDAATTDHMIVSLGSLFRHNLQTKQQQVTLEEELDALRDYVYLQQMRFDGRIDYEQKILCDAASVRLPSFTLQPVIENAYVRTAMIRSEITGFIENHYQEDISMQDAAAALRYSDAYFCKLFKQCFKVNFSSYLNEFRVQRAQQLLLDPRYNLREISTVCGYSDANYFTRVFKRLVGQTPSEYRLAAAQKAAEQN